MRCLSVLAAVFLAGCASMDADLKTADAACAQNGAITAYVACINRAEEPVWQKTAPASMADYRAFAAARAAMAEDLNSGKINQAQFQERAAQARATFQAALVKSGAQQQAAARRTEEEIQQIQQRAAQPGTDTMGMGMNPMGM